MRGISLLASKVGDKVEVVPVVLVPGEHRVGSHAAQAV
jgi:hypothetical protein